MVYMAVCVCGCVCVGFFPLHVLGPWTYDPHTLWERLARPVCFWFLFLFTFSFFGKSRMAFRKQMPFVKLLSAHMREQASALERAGKL